MNNVDVTALADRIRAVFALEPGTPALLYGGSWWTWAELERVGVSIIGGAAPEAVGAGPIGVMCSNAPPVVAIIVAALAAQRSVLVLNPMRPRDEVLGDLSSAGACAVVAKMDDWADGTLDTAHVGIGIEFSAEARDSASTAIRWRAPVPVPGPRSQVPPGSLIMQTSGTTGPPKRVTLPQRKLWDVLSGTAVSARAGDGTVRLRSGVVPVYMSLAHIGGLGGVLLPLLNGRKVALFDRFDPLAWTAVVKEYAVVTSGLVPAAMRMVLDAGIPSADLASLRSIRVGSAPLPDSLADEWESTYRIPILSAYGATEFGGGVVSMTLKDRERWGRVKRGSVGRAHPGVELRVVDPVAHTELLPGVRGHLEVKQGAGEWIATNDLAEIDDDGFLFILGRADDVINRGGFKVDPTEVKDALVAVEGIRDAVVVGIPDVRLGEVPAALVVVEEDAPHISETALRDRLRTRLAAYQLPVHIRQVDALPLGSTLKIDQAAARRLLVSPVT